VAGTIVEVRVRDNQEVRKGDVLMVIDPQRYRLAVDQAEASLRQRGIDMEQRRRELERRQRLGSSAISNETREQAGTAYSEAQAAYDQAKAALEKARLDLERTELRSPVNGFITNLLVQAGEYATAGRALVAVVDSDSFYVAGYFEETKLRHIHVGDRATVRLLSYGEPLEGHVEAIARAIADRENMAGGDLIANINPTFSWVRLAQRIPIRIALDKVPADARLTSGMTASVVVRPGSGDQGRPGG
jgi:RND family efflux transporter MFP subunit